MPTTRKTYQRQAEEKRRDDLINATIDLVAEGGIPAATVRAIADRAGVTPGLIRHYFSSKDELTRAAYRQVMDRMTLAAVDAIDHAPNDPLARLSQFVAANFRPPILDPVTVGVWAAFLHSVRLDPTMKSAHEDSYLNFRDHLQLLITALPRPADLDRDRRDAIACNAVIDGLWIEGGSLPDGFAVGELSRIALRAVGAILGIDLIAPQTN